MCAAETHRPFISPEMSLPEMTLKGVLLGTILSIIMTASNAYLGMYVGMTVSASIPAAVISMAILRGLVRLKLAKSVTILENNFVQTTASAGEALAAGVIFTIPALLMMNVWSDINYIIVFVLSWAGGYLGVLLSISLRRVFIMELKLTYPEGVACGEVLKSGEKGGESIRYVALALGIGGIYKMASSLVAEGKEYALGLWNDVWETAFGTGRTYFYFGATLSPALLGVGYIVGPEVGAYMIAGGALGWLIIIPLYFLFRGIPDPNISALDNFYIIWSDNIRYIGVGAMVVGGLWTLWKLRHSILTGIKESVKSFRGGGSGEVLRTEKDIPAFISFPLAGVLALVIFGIYLYLSGSFFLSLAAAVVMLIAAYLFSAIAAYLTGVVGSSNQPLSGMIIIVLIITALFMRVMGASGLDGMGLTILVAAVVGCSLAIAGDNLHDLKAGYVVGSTPMYQQIALLIGVLAGAVVIGPVLKLLNTVYGIGPGKTLTAPQAQLMAAITNAIFEGNLNYRWVFVGVILAVLLILLNKPVMPVAVGVYLPFTLSVPVFVGGLIFWLVDRMVMVKYNRDISNPQADRYDEYVQELKSRKERIHESGILFSSGLIAGEALMGVALAVLVLSGTAIGILESPVVILGFLAFAAVMAALITITITKIGIAGAAELINTLQETVESRILGKEYYIDDTRAAQEKEEGAEKTEEP
ncbi:MAG: oligopeptide transporter, OPT family [Thermoplasmata archaeon]